MKSQLAEAIGVNSRQSCSFGLRKRCFDRLFDFILEAQADNLVQPDGKGRSRTTYEAVLLAATITRLRGMGIYGVGAAAMGLSRSISTGRLCPVAAVRVQAYSPYRLCQLLERIAEECAEDLSTAAVDQWLRSRVDEL